MNFFKKTLIVATLFFGAFALSSCSEQKKEVEFIKTGNPDGKITIGALDGNNYSNDYFGLKMTFAEGLNPKPIEEMLLITGVTQETIDKGMDSEELIKQVENMIPLVFAYDKTEVFENDTVASIIVMAQKINDENKEFLSSASEYLRLTSKGLQSSYNDMGLKDKYTIDDPSPTTLNNKEFQLTRVKVDLSDGKFMYQDFYVIYTNGYSLFITGSYYDDAQKALVDQSINSITLE